MGNTTFLKPIPIIDLFAGPGGLGEGFSACGRENGETPFRICLSIEKDGQAYNTLRLRSFFRKFPYGKAPAEYYTLKYDEIAKDFDFVTLYEQFSHEAEQAEKEVLKEELGAQTAPDEKIDRHIRKALANAKKWVLIGGPPCQAYSNAGRSRNRAKENYVPEEDNRHFLYREYLRIIAKHWPSAFVMENVKGLLTSKVNGNHIFRQILQDLQNPYSAIGISTSTDQKRYRYKIYSFVKPADEIIDGFPFYKNPYDFVIESEHYGIPQARHRVILLGIREDICVACPRTLKRLPRFISVQEVLNRLPRLRSGLSQQPDSPGLWRNRILGARDEGWLSDDVNEGTTDEIRAEILAVFDKLNQGLPQHDRGGELINFTAEADYLKEWFLDKRLAATFNSSTRAHMVEDLHRYIYVACFGKVKHKSPLLADFPAKLLPAHKNVSRAMGNDNFSDRFRVQLGDKPSTTIMSHISKDGHYYIHPDPTQCRSLTVREAARLQTFPDNYVFTGSRTQQYTQVGNAVPPVLAKQLAEIVQYVLRR
jgi:DNA (cytosine-5)-methyltransferase 1